MKNRPSLATGRQFMVSAGETLATEAAYAILEAGGNAIDAGVAASIALGVVQSEQVQFSGVAPILVYIAEQRRAWSISGLGWWPKAARIEAFMKDGKGAIPEDITRSVIPGAPDAFITALERFGTMSFGEVAAAAIRYARDGFAVHRIMATFLADREASYLRWPQNAAIWFPEGRPLKEGERIIQEDLGRALQYMADEEKAASGGGRLAGLAAARAAFYKGDIAATIVRFHTETDGWMTAEDLAEFRVEIETPLTFDFHGTRIMSCGPWCQGPILLEMLSLLKAYDLKESGHNTSRTINLMTQVMDLCFADRERYFGDPRFVDVPIRTLLSPEYAEARRANIVAGRSFAGMPQPGSVGFGLEQINPPRPSRNEPGLPGDTSHASVVDRQGNAFACSPSDPSWEGPVVPGLGFLTSPRGSQSWAVPGHASAVQAGKRPRLTPNPSIAIRPGEFIMPFGAPGGDTQPQGMLQVFLNHLVFGMDIQTAVDQPRFITRNFPDSFEPHNYFPGRLDLEEGIGEACGGELAAMGHQINWLPEFSIKTAGVHVVKHETPGGTFYGAADPRRTGSAMGR